MLPRGGENFLGWEDPAGLGEWWRGLVCLWEGGAWGHLGGCLCAGQRQLHREGLGMMRAWTWGR